VEWWFGYGERESFEKFLGKRRREDEERGRYVARLGVNIIKDRVGDVIEKNRMSSKKC